MARSAQEQKTIIGYMILAARKCHLSADVEEKLDFAMRSIMAAYPEEDALEIFEDANQGDDRMPTQYERGGAA